MTLVTIVDADWSRAYGVDDLEQFLLDPPAPPPIPQRPDVPYIGPERPGDAFTASTDAGALLEASGWTIHHVDRTTGDRHYTRPGKERRDGSSATVYADGHCCVWTDATQLTPRRWYDTFGLYAALHHGGDHRAAAVELGRQGYGARAVDLTWITPATDQPGAPMVAEPDDTLAYFNGLRLIDWSTFWDRQHAGPDWLLEPIIARGRSHALYAGAKSGKSLLMLAACAAIASGRAFLNNPARPPQHILYLDYEMTEEDVYERLEEFGYGRDDDLSHFHYALLPTIDPLDTAAGAAVVVAAAVHFGAVHVVVDTMSRAVAGDENDADTVRAFYRFTGLHLKSRGIGFHRLDHSGKDPTKGQRGTSAKNDDVDVVQQFVRRDGGLTLKATHRRMAWVPESVDITVTDGELGTEYTTNATVYPTGTWHIVKALDDHQVPLDVGRPKVRELMKTLGITGKNDAVSAALKLRRERSFGVLNGGDSPGDRVILPALGAAPRTTGTAPQNPRSDTGDSPGDSGGQVPGPRGAVSVSLETDSPGQPTTDTTTDIDPFEELGL